MKAVVCTRYGPPEVLQLTTLPTPIPVKNELRIRISATAVTSSDCYTRGLILTPSYRLLARLVLGWNAPRQPVLGMVLAGSVEAVGPDASRFQVGDRVFGFNRHRFGSYAEFITWPEDGLLCPTPDGLPDEAAAALVYGGLLGCSVLRKGRLQAGQKVLVYGASGAVGTAAVQIACLLGAQVTGVCGPGNLDLVTSLGASRVLDYTTEGIGDSGRRYDLIVDAVGRRKSKTALRDARDSLKPQGRIVSVDDGRPRFDRADLALVAQWAARGAFTPVIDRTYPLAEIVAAHRYVDNGHKRGNVVIRVQ